MTKFDPAELDEIRHHVDLAELAGRLGVELKKKGREYLGLCPFHNERTPSFTVVPGKFYHCFGCGAHGDAIGLLMKLRGLDFPAAVKALAEGSGVALGRADEEMRARAAERRRLEAERDAAEREQSIAGAREIWRSCRPATGTIVEDYLRSRGIDFAALGGLPPTIRFNPALRLARGDYRPAMVGAVQLADGKVGGVHRTYLRPDGKGKAEIERPKRMFGICWGGAVRLGPAAAHLRIGEGIETCASVAVALGSARGVWAALSLGNIAGGGNEDYLGEGHPMKPGLKLPVTEPDLERPGIILPDQVETLTICADADNKDPWSAEALIIRATARHRTEGLRVLVARPPTGMDCNDLLRHQRPGRAAQQQEASA
jgi:hypothetical protein